MVLKSYFSSLSSFGGLVCNNPFNASSNGKGILTGFSFVIFLSFFSSFIVDPFIGAGIIVSSNMYIGGFSNVSSLY